MNQFFRRAVQFPHFLYLLPFFFVFHGYAQNPAPVTFTDFVRLVAEYLFAAGVLLLTGWLIFRNAQKAALFSFGLLFLHLFFGAFHDALKSLGAGFFLAKYSVLLPLLAFAVVIFIVYLKRSNQHFFKFIRYLNLLFVVLILVDIPPLLAHQKKAGDSLALQPCAGCDKPDIFLVIADEYADSTSLADVFRFNNGPFLSELRKRGFFIAQSTSNYNFTPYAMASLFTMNYLPGLEGKNSSYADRLTCAEAINQNALWNFFEKSGYEFRNNSIYKMANIPTVTPISFFRIGTDFIASHTLLARIKRDLGYHLVTTLKIRSVIDDYTYFMDRINKRLLARLFADAKQTSEKSRFVYTHIHIPHYPYYYRKDGSQNPDLVKPGNEFSKEAYIDYLQYGNRIYLQLIDEIMKHSAKPPVILFMGDHGFREFANPSPEEKKVYFMNLNAVYLPGGDYSRFYKGISGVNQFRALLNTVFKQNLPMLKDSTSFLQE